MLATQWGNIHCALRRSAAKTVKDSEIVMDRDPPLASSGTSRLVPILLPSIGNILFVSIFLVLVFGAGNGLLNDGDTGYHIRTGEEILENWRIPTHDVYSAHVPPLRWTAHEWLSEVIMAGLFKTFGLTGLVIFFALLLSATHWLLFIILRARSDNLILVAIITLLATASSSIHWLARPHVFSLSFTLVWYYLLDRFQYQSHGSLRFLPFLMLVWVNIHGGFIFGLLLLFLYLGGNVLYSFNGPPQEREDSRKKTGVLIRVSIITLLTCLINPFGYEILLFPFKLASDRFVMDHVTEFMSPNFHDVLAFKYMLLATLGTLALSRTPLSLLQVGLLLLVSYMALYSARHVALFAIVVSPLLLRTSENVFKQFPDPLIKFFQTRNQNLMKIDRSVVGYLWPSGTVICVLTLALAGNVQFTFDDKRFPVAAAEFLNRENLSGTMFNNDEFGDYFIYRLWPKYRVFMDGRSDMYSEKLGSAYLKVANVQPGWKEVLASHRVSWVIFDTNSALTAALADDIEWQPIYSDKVATIFVNRASANQALLAKYSGATIHSRK